ncbi:hypothetical protein LPJ57_000926 [Coemansia sp. RSA 486]|nr:hypothetical protein LPJ57_000926 [Coemansia sp. RSA 486]KAJ2638640.1 hypothetical protein GGF40_001484 [Coemansia sp. RSA 1286]
MEALEEREKELRKQYLALSMELMVCRSTNQSNGLSHQSLVASSLGMVIQEEAAQTLDALSTLAMSAAERASNVMADFTALNEKIADLHSSVDIACSQAEEAIIASAHLQHEVSILLGILDKDC